MVQISPLQPTPVGAFRFNTETAHLEYYDGNQWVQLTSTSPEARTGGTRGISMGGANPTNCNVIQYYNISTTGNAADFGDLSYKAGTASGCASRTRGIYAGGEVAPQVNTIEYITIASLGNAADFGDISTGSNAHGFGCAANSYRGLLLGGYLSPAKRNTIEYITIATTGNTVDFGD